ncbi:MAG: glycosyltransferase [Coriobacteriia bacterium]|nr:glycosyltransferase [Coriobacteriia bacterium]
MNQPAIDSTAKGPARRLAYFSAQAVVEGQDSWAAVTEVVGGMERAGWQVDLFCPEYDTGKTPGVLVRLRRILGAGRRLARRLSLFDAVYIRVHPLAWSVARAARRAGVPVVQESNGSWEDAFVAWPSMRVIAPLVIAVQRAQYRTADAVIAVSDTLGEWIAAETGRTNVVVSPNGANARLFRPDVALRANMPERYVVFFGQFAPWQRIEVLLAAFRREAWPEGVHLVFVGDGALRLVVEGAAANDPRIRYLGALPYAEVPRVVVGALAAAVLTYAPDRAGYSPLKLYEAMACGVPVICSDTPGQAEYVREHEAGIVVPPEDPDAVAGAAAALAADPDGARAMGARGRRAVEERYSWDARAAERLRVVERAVVAKAQAGEPAS